MSWSTSLRVGPRRATGPTGQRDPNGAVWAGGSSTYAQHFNWNDDGERVALMEIADRVRGGDILDVGVGAGRTSWIIGLLSRSYIGVDYCAPMIDRAKRNNSFSDLRLGDARALEFDDASFDLVFFSNAGLDSLGPEDRRIAFGEFSRVLRPGGILLYSTLNRNGPFFRCGPGPVHHAGRPPSPYRVGRFAARFALNPREHIGGFLNVYRNRRVFEDHGDWAVDTMPTHGWSLIVHYATTAYARAEAARAGFVVEELIDQWGRSVEVDSDAADSAWFYVLAHRIADSPNIGTARQDGGPFTLANDAGEIT